MCHLKFAVFCAIVSHPADTIVSYMNKAKGSTVGSAAKSLGFAGLWAGLGPRIIMIGTLTALQWFIYDSVKVTVLLVEVIRTLSSYKKACCVYLV